MKQALEALEYGMAYNGWDDLANRIIQAELKANAAITSLRQAIEQAEKQESVIGTKTWYEDGKVITQNLYPSDVYKQEKQEPVAWNSGVLPLYPQIKDGETISVEYLETTPQPQREWVGLTDEERYGLLSKADWAYDPESYAVVIEAKLKEKNT